MKKMDRSLWKMIPTDLVVNILSYINVRIDERHVPMAVSRLYGCRFDTKTPRLLYTTFETTLDFLSRYGLPNGPSCQYLIMVHGIQSQVGIRTYCHWLRSLNNACYILDFRFLIHGPASWTDEDLPIYACCTAIYMIQDMEFKRSVSNIGANNVQSKDSCCYDGLKTAMFCLSRRYEHHPFFALPQPTYPSLQTFYMHIRNTDVQSFLSNWVPYMQRILAKLPCLRRLAINVALSEQHSQTLLCHMIQTWKKSSVPDSVNMEIYMDHLPFKLFMEWCTQSATDRCIYLIKGSALVKPCPLTIPLFTHVRFHVDIHHLREWILNHIVSCHVLMQYQPCGHRDFAFITNKEDATAVEIAVVRSSHLACLDGLARVHVYVYYNPQRHLCDDELLHKEERVFHNGERYVVPIVLPPSHTHGSVLKTFVKIKLYDVAILDTNPIKLYYIKGAML